MIIQTGAYADFKSVLQATGRRNVIWYYYPGTTFFNMYASVEKDVWVTCSVAEATPISLPSTFLADFPDALALTTNIGLVP